jgi:hypothetical protein
LQNCEEKIPTLDLTDYNEVELEYALYIISQVCDELAQENCVVIKITKIESE